MFQKFSAVWFNGIPVKGHLKRRSLVKGWIVKIFNRKNI